jgi:hypothetical protein
MHTTKMPPKPGISLWRCTVVFIHALRQSLCPSPGLLALLQATASGELLKTLDDGKRRRVTQSVTLPELLKDWILG